MEISAQERKKFLRIVLVLTIGVLLFMTFAAVRRMVVLALFVGINFGFAYLKRKVPTAFIRKYLFGIELVLFCTVMTSISFGPWIGSAMGALLMVVNYIAERRMSEYIFSTTLTYMVIGYFGYYLRFLPVFQAGMILTLVYNAIAFMTSKLQGARTHTLIFFNLVNILSNVFLFAAYGEWVLGLL
jgi:hypothetical protein